MKTILKTMTTLILLSLFTLSTSGFAQLPAPNPATLKDNMQNLGKEMKAISLAKGDPSKNLDSTESSKRIIDLLIDSIVLMPPKVAALNEPDQQKAAMADYQKLMAHMISLAGALKEDFALNQNTAANATLTEMVKAIQEAHKLFK